MSRWKQIGLVSSLALLSTAFQSSGAVVRAVLFFSPTCPHCHAVMTETLPPIMEEYGEQLQIVAIDTTTPGGQQLYQSAVQALDIPEERRAVPSLVVGTTVLVGSLEIPSLLPGLVETGLAGGGIGWPGIPGLLDALPPDLTGETALVTPEGDLLARFSQDVLGNGLAVLVLLATLGTLGWAAFQLGTRRPSAPRLMAGGAWRTWGVPVLATAGAAISVYLTYIESTGSLAACGPVGDCNAVQQSEYASLFGLVPVGALGVVGYGLILAIHVSRRNLTGPADARAGFVLLLITAAGTAFSAYLTFVEAFVIGAACAWCLSSAILMTLLLTSTIPEAKRWLTRSQPSRTPS